MLVSLGAALTWRPEINENIRNLLLLLLCSALFGHFLFAILLQTLRNKNVKAAAFGLEDFFNLGEFKCALIAVAVDC